MGELITNLENYSIYKSYVNDDISYYICIPNENMSKCQITLGFSDKNLSSLSKKNLIVKICEISDKLFDLNNESIYVIPNINELEFKNATLENDNRLYENILNKIIHPITQDIYNMLIKNGIKKNKINQTINIIKITDSDKKFAFWLSMRLGEKYINEIDYKSLLDKYTSKKHDKNKDIDIINHIPFSVKPVNNIDINPQENNNEIENSTTIQPINEEFENNQELENKNRLVKRLTKPTDKSLGFSSFKFIITFMTITIISSITIAYLLIK